MPLTNKELKQIYTSINAMRCNYEHYIDMQGVDGVRMVSADDIKNILEGYVEEQKAGHE